MLIDKINDCIKAAMINKNSMQKNTYKSIKSRALNNAKEKHLEVTDDIVIDSIKKELKELYQTKESYEKLTNPTDEQLDFMLQLHFIIINLEEEWLPQQLSEEELKMEVKSILMNLPGDVTFGVKMKIVMKELKDKADGKLINKIVKELN